VSFDENSMAVFFLRSLVWEAANAGHIDIHTPSQGYRSKQQASIPPSPSRAARSCSIIYINYLLRAQLKTQRKNLHNIWDL
jgi:hypothetical protein